MSTSDLVLQALLQAEADDAAAYRARYDSLATAPSRAVASAVVLQDAMMKQRESRMKLGSPQRGRAPAFSVGAPPPDTRRRIMGIPLGRLQPSRLAQESDQVPVELLQQAFDQDRDVYVRPGSKNYRPATLGLDEFKARADILSQVDVQDGGSIQALLTEPDREKALKGVKVRGGRRGGQLINVTNDLRESGMEVYGFDPFGGATQTDEVTLRKVLGDVERKRRPSSRYTEVKIKQILGGGSIDELNQLADDLRTEIVNANEFKIEMAPEELEEKQDLLREVMKKRQARLGVKGGKKVPKFKSVAEAAAAAREGKIEVGDAIEVGGRPAVWE